MRGACTIVSTESATRNERRPLVGRGSGLIEGAFGPQPHSDFIEVFGETASVEVKGRWRERGRMLRGD
jgi:hypothetical protein